MMFHSFWQAALSGSSGKADPCTGLRTSEDIVIGNLPASTFDSSCEVMLEREFSHCDKLYGKAHTSRFLE